jgi:hypothetical protein
VSCFGNMGALEEERPTIDVLLDALSRAWERPRIQPLFMSPDDFAQAERRGLVQRYQPPHSLDEADRP